MPRKLKIIITIPICFLLLPAPAHAHGAEWALIIPTGLVAAGVLTAIIKISLLALIIEKISFGKIIMVISTAIGEVILALVGVFGSIATSLMLTLKKGVLPNFVHNIIYGIALVLLIGIFFSFNFFILKNVESPGSKNKKLFYRRDQLKWAAVFSSVFPLICGLFILLYYLFFK